MRTVKMSSEPHSGAALIARAPEKARSTGGQGYRALKQRIKEAGLLEKQPRYYAARIAGNFGLLAVSLFLLFWIDSFMLQLLVTAPLLAFTYVQLSFLGHNSGHNQVGVHAWQDSFLTHLHFGLLLGTSASWWLDRHNTHHGRPNVHDEDPDIDFPFLAFREEEALASRGIPRLIIKYQAFIFPFLSLLVPLNMRLRSILKILSGEARHPWRESGLMVTHFVLYTGLLLAALPALQALVFAVVHHAVVGIYFVSVFAANHKGMPVLDRTHQLDFVHLQVLTSRNVRSHLLTDFLYGGLNFQIEHHRFPTMPQNKLRDAQPIVREFCHAEGISYHETSFIQAQKEILVHLYNVGACIRAPRTVPKTA